MPGGIVSRVGIGVISLLLLGIGKRFWPMQFPFNTKDDCCFHGQGQGDYWPIFFKRERDRWMMLFSLFVIVWLEGDQWCKASPWAFLGQNPAMTLTMMGFCFENVLNFLSKWSQIRVGPMPLPFPFRLWLCQFGLRTLLPPFSDLQSVNFALPMAISNPNEPYGSPNPNVMQWHNSNGNEKGAKCQKKLRKNLCGSKPQKWYDPEGRICNLTCWGTNCKFMHEMKNPVMAAKKREQIEKRDNLCPKWEK